MVIRFCPVRFASAKTRLRPSSRRSIVRSLPPLLPTLSGETVVWSVVIDMALHLVARLAGVERARQVRRGIQYDTRRPV